MQTKTCVSCEETKTIKLFGFIQSRNQYRARCKPCQGHYNKQFINPQYFKDWYNQRRDQIIASNMRSNAANPFYKWALAVVHANKKAQNLGAAGKITLAQIKRRLKRCNNKCEYCGSTDRLSIDHKKPFALKGSNHIRNIVIACLICNHKKSRYKLNSSLITK